MFINNKDVVRNLYRMNLNASNNTIVVVKSRIKNSKQKLILLGKIYCQGFSLVSLREEKGVTWFVIKKIQEPKLKEEKSYSFIKKLFIYPYCEYLTFEVLHNIKHRLYINPNEKYTFLGKMWYRMF